MFKQGMISYIPYLLVTLSLTLIAYDYDLIIIGAGLSGMQVAKAATQYVKKIAIIDPTSNSDQGLSHYAMPTLLSHAGSVGYQLRAMGLTDALDTHSVLRHVRSTMLILQKQRDLFLKDHVIHFLSGAVHFTSPHTIMHEKQVLSAARFVIAVDKDKKPLPTITGLDAIHCLEETDIYTQDVLPQSLTIIGCNAQAVMLASTLSNLGVAVTVLVKYGLLLSGIDYEMVEHLSEYLKKIGVTIHVDTFIESVEKQQDGTVLVHCIDGYGQEQTYATSALFVARASGPNITYLQLGHIGVAHTQEGIIVDDTLKTSVDTIYACGDAVDCKSMAVSFLKHQAKIAAHNACASHWTKKLRCLAREAMHAVYTTAPLVSIGLSEQDAIKRYGLSIHTYRVPYSVLEQSYIDNTATGMAKFICDASGILVGAHIFGAYSEHLIRDVYLGKQFKYQGDFYCSHVYPDYKEILWLATQQSRKDDDVDTSFWGILRLFISNYFSL